MQPRRKGYVQLVRGTVHGRWRMPEGGRRRDAGKWKGKLFAPVGGQDAEMLVFDLAN